MHRPLALFITAVAISACAGEKWPDPPPVDQAQYRKDFDAWREEHRQGLSSVLPIVGIWRIAEGETPFGSDAALPITLPAAHFPARAGIVRRTGDAVTIVPAPGAPLRLADGSPLTKAVAVDTFGAGPVSLLVISGDDDRRWLMGMDESHPAAKNPPMVDTYPLDPRWRVAAQYLAFDKPRPVRVPDVRGGEMEFMATGQLVFRIEEREMKLTAFGEPGSEDFFVMFKDPTNQSTTYRGYRIVTPKVVKDQEWTVIDFNFANNPPCAYSKFTLCPLPPPENKVPVAIEAGLKRLPDAKGYGE